MAFFQKKPCAFAESKDVQTTMNIKAMTGVTLSSVTRYKLCGEFEQCSRCVENRTAMLKSDEITMNLAMF